MNRTEIEKYLLYEYPDDHTLIAEILEELVAKEGDYTKIIEKTHEPVSVEQFIRDPYFMGGILDEIWESVVISVCEVVEGGYAEALLTGAIGCAKTTRATIIVAYHLYILSCYVDPQKKLGLMAGSEIIIAMLNKTDALARDVTYKKFRMLISKIPYFQENFMYRKDIERKMVFPNEITVIYAAATNDKLLGMDVVDAIVDEINFFAHVQKSKRSTSGGLYDQAVEVYNGLVRRVKSRFLGLDVTVRGCICLVSSRSHTGDFIDVRISEIKRDSTGDESRFSYIDNRPQWEMLPKLRSDGLVRYCGKNFLVAIGSERLNSQIIISKDDAKEREVIDIPIEYLKDFKADIDGSLRDFAGRVSRGKNAYFYDMERVWAATRSFEVEEYQQLFVEEKHNLLLGMPALNPNYTVKHPLCYRAIHVDLALNGDLCGFACGYSPYDTTQRSTTLNNEYKEERVITVVYDVLLGIHPQKGQDIEFSDVRSLIYYLRDVIKIPVKWVSFDGFQSVDSRQILRSKGFKTARISVEGTDSYQALRTAYMQKRIHTQQHQLYHDELSNLERDHKTKKIDHPANSSKDIADGVCGVYVSLASKRLSSLRSRGNSEKRRGRTRRSSRRR